MSKARSISDLIDESGLVKAEALAITGEGGVILVDSIPTIPTSKVDGLDSALDDKVDKVSGKGLSTEDYTTAEKSKLDGIEAGAQVNTVDSVAGKTGAVTLNKNDVGLSNVDNTSDANKPISSATQSALNDKVDKVSGKGLSTEDYTTAEKNKLDGIEAGAQVNVGTNLGSSGTGETRTITSSTGTNTSITYTKADVGLSNVDNTSDANKPISSATQSALNLKVAIADIENVLTSNATDKPLSANQGKVLKTAIDNINSILASDDTTLDELQEIVDFIKQNRQDLDTLGISNIAGLQNALDDKVDKVSGKGLSTEDYTTAEKNKLDGIEAGAQVNVGTNLGQGGTGDSRTITSSTGTDVTVSTATTSNAGFMSVGDKTKLDNLATVATSGDYEDLANKPDSDGIPEGATNLYFTAQRAQDAIKADADWNAADWDAAFGWGDHSAVGYLLDAPLDGEQYVRKDGSWEAVDIQSNTEAATRFETTLTESQTLVTGFTLGSFNSVYLNGVLLKQAEDYALDFSENEITLLKNVSSGDQLTLVAFVSFEVADAYTKAEVDFLLQSQTDSIDGEISTLQQQIDTVRVLALAGI